MLQRIFISAFFIGISLFCSKNADAWHRHYWGAYGAGFYHPNAFFYAGPQFYSGYYFGSRPFQRWHGYRPHHHWHRPHFAYRPIVASYYVNPVVYTPPVIHYSAPVYYSAPVQSCNPIIYTQPAVNLDCCSNFSGEPSSLVPSTTSPTTVDPQLQIRQQSRPVYSVAQDAEWLNLAVAMIDDMASNGGLVEAEQACEQLISVRENVPSSIYLRAGILALRNGKGIQHSAQYFTSMQSDVSSSSIDQLLSNQFINALNLKDFQSIEADVQQASKMLLAGSTPKSAKIRLTSESKDTVTVLKPATVHHNQDAAVVLGTLLRVNGQHAKADQIDKALQEQSSL